MKSNFCKHIKMIRTHRKHVIRACFNMGIPLQGFLHDLSKYSLTELKICKYYTGTLSPHDTARKELGYSPSWIHHYHSNKHHFQYWWDEDEEGKIIPMRMPFKYIMESFCDMLGASKAYNPKNWKPEMLLNYWETKCKGKRIQHPASEEFLDKMIKNLVTCGEEAFFEWYKNNKDFLKKAYEEM